MIEIEDECSNSWTELPEQSESWAESSDTSYSYTQHGYDNNCSQAMIPKETRRVSESVGTRLSQSNTGHHQSEAELTEVQQRRRDFINRNRARFFGADEDSHTDTSRYTKRPRNLSPLRSPINRARRSPVRDMDNIRSIRGRAPRSILHNRGHRYTNNIKWSQERDQNDRFRRRLSPPRYDGYPDEGSDRLQADTDDHRWRGEPRNMLPNRGRRYFDMSPKRDQNDRFPRRLRLSYGDDEFTDEGRDRLQADTDEFTRHRRGGAQRSLLNSHGHRRSQNNIRSPERDQNRSHRLHLPSDDGGLTAQRDILQEDRVRMARREKDIQYGKNTDDYKTYIATVPKNKRSRDRRVHPRTPEKFDMCSRRSWDTQIKNWKLRIHEWAKLQFKSSNPRNDDSQSNLCSETSVLTDDTNQGEDLFLQKDGGQLSEEENANEQENQFSQDDSFRLSEEEDADKQEDDLQLTEEKNAEDDDYSFLDAVNIGALSGVS